MTYLRLCPHCGNQAELSPQGTRISCMVCKSSTRECETTTQAIEEWNSRAFLCPNCGKGLDPVAELYDHLGRRRIICRHCRSEVILGESYV